METDETAAMRIAVEEAQAVDTFVIQTDRRHRDRRLLKALGYEFATASFEATGYNIRVHAPGMELARVEQLAKELLDEFYADRSTFRARRLMGAERDGQVVVRINRNLAENARLRAEELLLDEVPGCVLWSV